MASYALLFFRHLDQDIGWLGDVKMETNFGWYLIACVTFNIMANMVFMSAEAFRVLIFRVKVWCLHRRIKKIILSKQAKQKENEDRSDLV